VTRYRPHPRDLFGTTDQAQFQLITADTAPRCMAGARTADTTVQYDMPSQRCLVSQLDELADCRVKRLSRLPMGSRLLALARSSTHAQPTREVCLESKRANIFGGERLIMAQSEYQGQCCSLCQRRQGLALQMSPTGDVSDRHDGSRHSHDRPAHATIMLAPDAGRDEPSSLSTLSDRSHVDFSVPLRRIVRRSSDYRARSR